MCYYAIEIYSIIASKFHCMASFWSFFMSKFSKLGDNLMKKWAMALGVLALCACNDNASDKQAVSNTTPPPCGNH